MLIVCWLYLIILALTMSLRQLELVQLQFTSEDTALMCVRAYHRFSTRVGWSGSSRPGYIRFPVSPWSPKSSKARPFPEAKQNRVKHDECCLCLNSEAICMIDIQAGRVLQYTNRRLDFWNIWGIGWRLGLWLLERIAEDVLYNLLQKRSWRNYI
jgi:hypothetical protein